MSPIPLCIVAAANTTSRLLLLVSLVARRSSQCHDKTTHSVATVPHAGLCYVLTCSEDCTTRLGKIDCSNYTYSSSVSLQSSDAGGRCCAAIPNDFGNDEEALLVVGGGKLERQVYTLKNGHVKLIHNSSNEGSKQVRMCEERERRGLARGAKQSPTTSRTHARRCRFLVAVAFSSLTPF